MMRHAVVICGCLLSLSLPMPAFAQQSIPSRDRVLLLVREAVSHYTNSDIQATAHIQFSTDAGLSKSSLLIKSRKKGSRALLSVKEVTDRPGQETTRMQMDYIMESNGDVYDFQTKLDSSLKQVDYTESHAELRIALYSQRLAGKQRVDRQTVYDVLNDAGAIVWVIGYAPLLDYLDHATQLEVTPAGDGVQILASGDYGRLRMAVSPSSGWLPRTFELTKEVEHKTINGRVGDVYRNSVRSVVWAGEVGAFTTDANGRHSPGKIDIHRRTNWKDKPVETLGTSIDIEKSVFEPTLVPSDFQTDITAPAGYRVTIMDAVNLPYRWDGRKIEPGTPDLPRVPDQVVYENLKNLNNSKRSRTLLFVFNILALLSIFGILLWRRRSGARGS